MSSNDQVYLSPRISALQMALEDGDTSALDTFWQELAAQGAPIIEPILGDEQHALVTVIYQGDEQTSHVVFYSELLRGMWWHNWADALLTRLGQTTLYYRTYRVRRDMRFVYWLSPNHPLYHTKDVTNWADYIAHLQTDPLNPNIFREEKDRSYVEMPAATPQPWFQSRPAVAPGTLKQRQWHSKLLDNDRQVWTYTPAGYGIDGDTYPLLVLFDGNIYTTYVPAPTILDNLIAAGRIPPLVAVMLDSPARSQELYCYEPFADFVTQELLPWVHQAYHVTRDPRRMIVGGMSAGGLAAAYIGLRHSEIFGNVLSQSGAFNWGPETASQTWSYEPQPEGELLIRQFATQERIPLRFYLDAGLLEDQRDIPQTTLLRANRHMRNVLQAKGYPVHYIEFSGGHQYINWRGTLPDGLMALIGT